MKLSNIYNTYYRKRSFTHDEDLDEGMISMMTAECASYVVSLVVIISTISMNEEWWVHIYEDMMPIRPLLFHGF